MRPRLPAPAPAAAVPAPTTSIAGWVNGPASPNNTFQRFGMSGADLGILWDNGNPSNDQVLIAFGDTYGDCSVPSQQWRRNTMFRSPDSTLADGITVPDGVVGDHVRLTGRSTEFLQGDHRQPQPGGNGAVSYFDRRHLRWGNPIRQLHVRQAVGQSRPVDDELFGDRDVHRQWRKLAVDLATIRSAGLGRVPGLGSVSGNQNFQQGAFMRPGDGYVSSFGTPSGRGGAAHLARVPENSVLDLTQYDTGAKPSSAADRGY